MRSYQIESLRFFLKLYNSGVGGGILADEMVSWQLLLLVIDSFFSCRLSKWPGFTILTILFFVQGLGKTLQSIALMGHLCSEGIAKGIHIVICPLSTMGSVVRLGQKQQYQKFFYLSGHAPTLNPFFVSHLGHEYPLQL